MIAHRAPRPRRHRRAPAVFQLAPAPLRRTVQGRVRDRRDPQYPQVQMHPDDLAPVLARARHYRFVPLPAPRPVWERQLSHALILAVIAVILFGLR